MVLKCFLCWSLLRTIITEVISEGGTKGLIWPPNSMCALWYPVSLCVSLTHIYGIKDIFNAFYVILPYLSRILFSVKSNIRFYNPRINSGERFMNVWLKFHHNFLQLPWFLCLEIYFVVLKHSNVSFYTRIVNSINFMTGTSSVLLYTF